jgi:hypothetical protein
MSSEISFSSELEEALNVQPSSPVESPSSRQGHDFFKASQGRHDRSRDLPGMVPTALALEECKHEVLFHGICGVYASERSKTGPARLAPRVCIARVVLWIYGQTDSAPVTCKVVPQVW